MHSYSVCFERMVSGFEEILATGERSCGFFLFTVKQNKSYHLFTEGDCEGDCEGRPESLHKKLTE